ncbi:IPT/TIG domain-containing protein [Ferruginibacter albus]|uniref:IPT/TIG domain-containing protein n=1 Tax=Ferruginibacter albus TaxID=2875540 RepID=UPI001CC37740|nr:IPT/TIG domain-containing protein [Ferruginibacter albus]UAY51212.1 IPT/TIG domain-containing protein [Ferruginibacter albus]
MKLKNAMLGIVGGLFALSVGTISCSKDDNPSPGAGTPTISSFTPSSAAAGATVTINGTNLTGATSVKFGGTAATSFTVVSATQITAVVGAGATGTITVTTPGGTATSSTSFTFSAVAQPTSDSVAHAFLLAKWTFDSDSKEFATGTPAAQTVGTVTYTNAGAIGNCATFTNGALVYPIISTIDRDTALQSYTLSMWVNIPASTGSEGLRSLFQINGTRFPDLWGLVSMELANNGVVGDSLAIQSRQVQVDGNAPYVHNQVIGPNNTFGVTGKWTLLTVTYNGNGNNQTITLYVNGNKINQQELTTVTKPETFRIVPTGADAGADNKVTIGTLEFYDLGFTLGNGYGQTAPLAADRPWAQNGITGKIDDIRLFNTAISDGEVMNLYTYGSQGK